jgi:hypothetical protein
MNHLVWVYLLGGALELIGIGLVAAFTPRRG